MLDKGFVCKDFISLKLIFGNNLVKEDIKVIGK